MRRASILLLALTSAAAHTQVLQTNGGSFFVTAFARAHTVEDNQSTSGSSSTSSFSLSRSAYAEFNDPSLGLHTASGATSLMWTTSTAAGVTTLAGGVGGVAETWSQGLDTLATGASTVQVEFQILEASNARIESQGTYNSDLYVWDNGSWVGYMTGFTGVEHVVIAPGLYRWDAGAGETASGTSFYSSGIDFSIQAQAVPEPSAMAAVGLGLAVFLRRRR